MKSTPLVVLVILAVTLLTSYKKKDNTMMATRAALLTAHSWQVEKVIASNQAGIGSVVVYKKGASHNNQDFSHYQLTFKEDGTYQGTDENGHSGSGTWQLTNNASQLSVDGGSKVSDLVMLSDSQLNIRATDSRTGQTVQLTLKKTAA